MTKSGFVYLLYVTLNQADSAHENNHVHTQEKCHLYGCMGYYAMHNGNVILFQQKLTAVLNGFITNNIL